MMRYSQRFAGAVHVMAVKDRALCGYRTVASDPPIISPPADEALCVYCLQLHDGIAARQAHKKGRS